MNSGGKDMILYFAYGSNMSLKRMQQRVPGVQWVGNGILRGYQLRFNKIGADGSGKCSVFFTQNPLDIVFGVLYELTPHDRVLLDCAEGLGKGYCAKDMGIELADPGGGASHCSAFTYLALLVDDSVAPFDWYKEHVLVGASENCFPSEYIRLIEQVPSIKDPDNSRSSMELSIYRHVSRDEN